MGKRVEKTNYLVNGVNVEQRLTDGFINGTSMALAHEKKINDWFRTNDTLELFQSLMDGLGLQTNYGKSRNLEAARLSASKYAEMFPGLVFTKSGSPELGGGTWLHPDLAIQLAQWCNKPFALQVSRWVREWMTSAYNPSRLELDKDSRRLPILWIETENLTTVNLGELEPAIDDCLFYGLKPLIVNIPPKNLSLGPQ